MKKDWITQLKDWQERQDQILEIYEAGVPAKTIMAELKISKGRVYQILKAAKERRDAKKSQEPEKQTMEADK